MRLDKLLTNNGLPTGDQRLAAIQYKYLRRKKWASWLETVPHGLARGRSLYTSEWTVVLLTDAISAGLPVVHAQTLKV